VVVTPKWTRFYLEGGPDSDRMVDALKQGPVKVVTRPDGRVLDLDRIDRWTPRRGSPGSTSTSVRLLRIIIGGP
jgi:hypothetical protein